jgi:hypothetical protein
MQSTLSRPQTNPRLKEIYNLGFSHGIIKNGLYQPDLGYSYEERLSYSEGFDDACDELIRTSL